MRFRFDEITNITSTDNFLYWSPFPSLKLRSHYSNMSRVLSSKHANKLAKFCLGGLELDP
jgi:hypothetical protein